MNTTCPTGAITVACLNLGQAVLTVASMLSVMIIIVLGNLLVVFTVYRDRKLRSQRQNWLIVSLAIADLLVGFLVMPLTLIYEVVGRWEMGMVLCEMWLALDVLFVTASILHICAISLDRYFSVTSPLTYPSKRTAQRMFIYIGVSWVVSLLICLPPIFGWRPERAPGECNLSKDVGYVLYSSLGSFYIPVIILIIVYARIYQISIKHSRQRLKETERRVNTLSQLSQSNKLVEMELIDDNSDPNEYAETTASLTTERADQHSSRVCWQARKLSIESTQDKKGFCSAYSNGSTVEINSNNKVEPKLASPKDDNGVDKLRRKLKAKERQATLLLGIILSAFILSWLPFFIMYVIGAFGYDAPEIIFKFFFWLGYCNSGINPVIYTVFNRDFKRGLCRQLRKLERHVKPLSNRYK